MNRDSIKHDLGTIGPEGPEGAVNRYRDRSHRRRMRRARLRARGTRANEER
jgi:hypothetical protein